MSKKPKSRKIINQIQSRKLGKQIDMRRSRQEKSSKIKRQIDTHKLKKQIESGALNNITLGKLTFDTVNRAKVLKKSDNLIKVAKYNNKTQFYSINYKNGSKLNLSVKGKSFLKKFPELHDFLMNAFFENGKLKDKPKNKNLILKKHVIENKTNKNYAFHLKDIHSMYGRSHQNLCKLNIKDISNKKNYNFFIKIYDFAQAHNEFIANQGFQKFGLNTIKPHYAYTNSRNSIIVYDFTNMLTVREAYNKKIISYDKYDEIEKKLFALHKHNLSIKQDNKFLNKIQDYQNTSNVFIRTVNGKAKLYFTDLNID